MKDLIALAKSKPGILNYGSVAQGSPVHIAAELFKSMAGVDIVRISYPGSLQALTETVSGQVHIMFSPTTAIPFIKSGRLKGLAVTSPKTSALLPELPTIAASGLPGYGLINATGMFAPAGTAFSLDRLIRIRRGLEGPALARRAPWAQRMIQFELALMYFAAFCWKLKGHTWLQGTALFYVLHLQAIARFPLPGWIQHPAILRIGSWFTLLLEFSLGVLIWFRRFRYPLLLAGILFHLSIEYALNLPMFEWDVLTAYVLFLDPADLERAWRVVQQRRLRA